MLLSQSPITLPKQSTAKGSDQGVFEVSAGDWFADAEADKGLRTTQDLRFYTVGAKLQEAFSNADKDLVVQFSVKHEKRQYSFCGGGYIKLLPSDVDLTKWDGDTGYHVMFGPDLCGYDVSRIHSIFNFKGENLLKDDDVKLEYADKNEFTHLYSLVVKKDKTFTLYFDLVEKASGLLTDAWKFPAKMIDDPTDKKPEDWVDVRKIPDPVSGKPL
jgi:calreticulin